MKKIPKVLLLYVLNWVLFIVFYALQVFDALIFKTVSLSISQLPVVEVLRTIILVLWLIVPQTLVLTAANKTYLQLPAKKFILTQFIFGISVVLILYIVLSSLKIG
jgi:hypothetical protein